MEFLTREQQATLVGMPSEIPTADDLTHNRRSARTLSKAVSLHVQGKLEGAARLLQRDIDAGNHDAALYSALANIQYELRDFVAAASNYAKLAELEPSHRTAHFNLAVCLCHLAEWRRAVDSFRRALEIDRSRYDALLGLATSLLHAGHPGEAGPVLDEYLTLFPENEQAIFGRAVSFHQTGRHAEAVTCYRKVLARNPRSEEALANLVAMFQENRDLDSLRRYAAMLAELRPESRTAVEALSTVAFAEGDYAAAAWHCRALVDTAPDRYENWFNLGVASQKIGQLEQAAQAYAQAAALKPDSSRCYLNLGVVQQELSDLAAARGSYENAVRIDPGQPGALWNLALVLEQQGERAEAERVLGRIPQDAPEWGDACFRLGYLRLLRGEYAGSVESFETCLGVRRDWTEAYLNAGIAYARLGQTDQAKRCFQQAHLLRPDFSGAVRGLAALALDQRNFEEALQLQRQLIDLGDHSPELYYNVALICHERGKLNEAVDYYQHAIEENPGFAEALLNLGHALLSLGREEDAHTCWERAIDEKPDLAQGYFEPPVAGTH
jgi:tetratricopeptide (TPR) repeat protein